MYTPQVIHLSGDSLSECVFVSKFESLNSEKKYQIIIKLLQWLWIRFPVQNLDQLSQTALLHLFKYLS